MIATEQRPDDEVQLRPYRCQQYDSRLHRLCTAIVVDAYAPAGAIIRRKCGVCHQWNVIRIPAETQE